MKTPKDVDEIAKSIDTQNKKHKQLAVSSKLDPTKEQMKYWHRMARVLNKIKVK